MYLDLQDFVFPREVEAVTSKSVAHRLLILGALSSRESSFKIRRPGSDIQHTVDCLRALGAEVTLMPKLEFDTEIYKVKPIDLEHPPRYAVLNCGDSGSTLRFLLPVAAALGVEATFIRTGRLAERPLGPLQDVLHEHGVRFFMDDKGNLCSRGTFDGTDFSIPGNISSQFITGLLFAMAIFRHPSHLSITGELESAPYLQMTIGKIRMYKVPVRMEGMEIEMPGRDAFQLRRPRCPLMEGDWSGSAVFLAAGAVSRRDVTVHGLDTRTVQGDRAILSLLMNFHAAVSKPDGNSVRVEPSSLKATYIDARHTPDLVPILAVLALCASGKTVIDNASRLRLKESNRLAAVTELLNAVGGNCIEFEDGLIIYGVDKRSLRGALVDSKNDHRIAMAAALIATMLPYGETIRIRNAECVDKSWPHFWDDLGVMGKLRN